MSTLTRQAALSDILIRRGTLHAHQLESLLGEAHGSQLQLIRLLLDRQLVPEDELAQAIADQYGLSFHPLHDHRIAFEEFPGLSLELMRELRFVPIADHDGLLTLALADPYDLEKLDRLERCLDRPFSLVVAPRGMIEVVLSDSARSSQVVARVT